MNELENQILHTVELWCSVDLDQIASANKFLVDISGPDFIRAVEHLWEQDRIDDATYVDLLLHANADEFYGHICQYRP